MLSLGDESFHHLTKVIRIKNNENVLLLNGIGLKAIACIQNITKKEIVLKVESVTTCERLSNVQALVFAPKKDALDLMLKSACELGIETVYLYRGEFSQERLPEERRIQAILQSAVEQSNNPWMPNVVILESIEKMDPQNFEKILLLDLNESESSQFKINLKNKNLIVVGPEAGFSETERENMKKWGNAYFLNFPTPILRAPTALVAGLGWMYARA
ncbi:MAG: 16S rRNA (uracil(1498)-N(3))-methyltransferase [Bacteriovoracaceae bacterium]|nr:16S rRNA (uracil(1498)-N(3))-methyltransferase [Bacteriovoracaceae bacterium]